MYSNLKKGLFLVTFSGAAMLLPVTAKAADTQSELPSVGIEEVLDHCYSAGKEIEIEKYLVPTKKGEYLDMAFADVETFLYIRSEPTTESEWVGKLYPDDAAKIMGPVDEWTKVQSGSVTGYVYSKYITVGKKAEEKAQKIVKKKQEKRLTIYTRVFDYDKIKGDISCRTRQQGDSIAIGNGHQKKLKDFLIDAKIARQKRDMLLLFAVGKQILWIPGYRISSDFTANETTKNKLWISVWEGEKNERTY